ncbi:MAG: hypothetical protein ICV64_01295 [Thermoleophilia bacterium]|nr:hypothetical protein [Thermoleophilia bacterium]
MPLEHAPRRLEVAGQHAAQRLGIELLAERGRARDVAEDDGHDLPHVALGLARQRRTARAAEAEAGGVLLAALAARRRA